MKLLMFFLILLVLLPKLALADFAQSEGPQTLILMESSKRPTVGPIVFWKSKTIPTSGTGGGRSVKLSGKLNPKLKTLFINELPVSLRGDQSFEMSLKVSALPKVIALRGEDGAGASFDSRYELRDPGKSQALDQGIDQASSLASLQNSGKKSKVNVPPKWRGSFGVGVTQLHYEQTGVNRFVESLITLKVGAETTLIPNKVTLGAGVFYNAFELANTGNYQIKVLGTNLRIGYFLTQPTNALQFKINGGLYYNTSISDIGFKNMFGPQVFPELSFRLSKTQGIMLYAKYSPVLVAGSLDILKSKELATGLYYRYSLNDGKSIFVGIDYAELDAYTNPDEAHTRTVSLGTGMGF